MDLFLSHFSGRLDAKGRVSIPAPFRAVLASDGIEGLYVCPCLDLPALDCGGNALLGEIARLLEKLPPYSQERELVSTALLGTSEMLKVDGEGRIVLTERLKTESGIGAEVAFVGLGGKFQIWEPERFRLHLEAARHRLREMRQGARQ